MDLDFEPVIDSAQFLLGGVGLTLALSALTILTSLALGGALGLRSRAVGTESGVLVSPWC